ncbi:MAG: 2'-5' RNA ligase family protein [Methanolinea sp.]|jgi:hypothetical protein|nr:hypothetical protein [Methanolinea sp.]
MVTRPERFITFFIAKIPGLSRSMPHQRTPGHRNRMMGIHDLPSYIVTISLDDREFKKCISDLAGYFNIGEHERHEPHITLLGPFHLSPGRDPASILMESRILEKVPPIFHAELGAPLMLRGKRGYAIVIRAEPENTLAGFATEMRKCLTSEFTDCTWIDRSAGIRIYHVSLGFGLRRERAETVLRTLEESSAGAGRFPGTCLVAGNTVESGFLTVIRRGVLWRVFDLRQRKWLSRGVVFKKG